MNWDRVEGNWKEFKGKVQQKWGKLTNDDLDLIISANGKGVTPDAKQVNNAIIMYTSNETKRLGELRFFTDATGVVDRFTVRYVELDEVIPDDPKMAEVTKQARDEIDATRQTANCAVLRAANGNR